MALIEIRRKEFHANWPRACVGCGSDQGDLQSYPFHLHKTIQGFGVKTDTDLDVKTLLCPDCVIEGKQRNMAIVIKRAIIFLPFLMFIILTSELVFTSMRAMSDSSVIVPVSDNPLIESINFIIKMIYFPVTVIGLTLGGSIPLFLLLERNPARRNIKIIMQTPGIRYVFENALYTSAFTAVNPGADVGVGRKKIKVKFDADELKKIEEQERLNALKAEEPKKFFSVTFGPTGKEPEEIQATKTCPNCAAIIANKVKFCNKCGYKFENSKEEKLELSH
jgi:hypothetical protein